MSYSNSNTYSFSVADIEKVVRPVTADFVMIANSSGGTTEEKARMWAHDVSLLAKNDYLTWVDITLFSGDEEKKAVRFTVNRASGALTMSRPGGVLWPKVPNPRLRILVQHNSNYDAAAEKDMRPHLEINWTSTSESADHTSLSSTTGRDYSSNGYAIQRTDYSK